MGRYSLLNMQILSSGWWCEVLPTMFKILGSIPSAANKTERWGFPKVPCSTVSPISSSWSSVLSAFGNSLKCQVLLGIPGTPACTQDAGAAALSDLEASLLYIASLFVFFVLDFWDRVSLYSSLVLDSLCRQGWPQTQALCLPLPPWGTGIKGLHQHSQLFKPKDCFWIPHTNLRHSCQTL